MHAVSGGGGSFLRAIARRPPPPDPGVLHPPARTGSASGASKRTSTAGRPRGPTCRLRLLRPCRRAQLRSAGGGRLARVLRRLRTESPRTRRAPRPDEPRLADAPRGRGDRQGSSRLALQAPPRGGHPRPPGRTQHRSPAAVPAASLGRSAVRPDLHGVPGIRGRKRGRGAHGSDRERERRPLDCVLGLHARRLAVFSTPAERPHGTRVRAGARCEGDRADPRPRPETLRGEGRSGRHLDVRIRGGHGHAHRREAPRGDGSEAPEIRHIERREPGHEDGRWLRRHRGLPLSGLRVDPAQVCWQPWPHRVRDDARHIGRMDPLDRGDEFSHEGPSRLENDDELVRLFLRASPPVPRFDGPVVGTRGEPALDDDASDRPGGLAVRRGHIRHRMRNPSACHPISPPLFAIRVRNRNGFDGLLSGGPRVRDVTMPVVTMSETVAALRATVGKRGMAEEDLRALADYLMSFFGFETEAIDNNLDVADRDVFYMLEEEGLLTTRQEEVMIKKGKMWRIHYWNLRVERIKGFAKPPPPETGGDAFSVYNTLPEDILTRPFAAR